MKVTDTIKSDSKATKLLNENKEILLLFLASRVIFLALVFFSPTPFTEVWGLFDTTHYREIAANGYNEEITVFFPVIPLLIRYITDIGLIIVNNIAFIFSMILMRNLLRDHFNFKEYNTILGILAFSPQSFFSMLEYTESIFFLLTLSAFSLFLMKKHFAALGLILGLSVATRNSGSMLFLAIFAGMCLLWFRKEIKISQILITYIPATAISLIYPVYLQINYGNWKIFMDAQMDYWLRISSNIFKTTLIECQVVFTNMYHYDGMDFTILNKTNEALSLILFICTCILLFIELRPIIKSRKVTAESVVLVLYTVLFLITIHMTIRDPHVDCPTDSFYRYYAGLFPMYIMMKNIRSKQKLQIILLCTLFITMVTSYLFAKGIFFF